MVKIIHYSSNKPPKNYDYKGAQPGTDFLITFGIDILDKPPEVARHYTAWIDEKTPYNRTVSVSAKTTTPSLNPFWTGDDTKAFFKFLKSEPTIISNDLPKPAPIPEGDVAINVSYIDDVPLPIARSLIYFSHNVTNKTGPDTYEDFFVAGYDWEMVIEELREQETPKVDGTPYPYLWSSKKGRLLFYISKGAPPSYDPFDPSVLTAPVPNPKDIRVREQRSQMPNTFLYTYQNQVSSDPERQADVRFFPPFTEKKMYTHGLELHVYNAQGQHRTHKIEFAPTMTVRALLSHIRDSVLSDSLPYVWTTDGKVIGYTIKTPWLGYDIDPFKADFNQRKKIPDNVTKGCANNLQITPRIVANLEAPAGPLKTLNVLRQEDVASKPEIAYNPHYFLLDKVCSAPFMPMQYTLCFKYYTQANPEGIEDSVLIYPDDSPLAVLTKISVRLNRQTLPMFAWRGKHTIVPYGVNPQHKLTIDGRFVFAAVSFSVNDFAPDYLHVTYEPEYLPKMHPEGSKTKVPVQYAEPLPLLDPMPKDAAKKLADLWSYPYKRHSDFIYMSEICKVESMIFKGKYKTDALFESIYETMHTSKMIQWISLFNDAAHILHKVHDEHGIPDDILLKYVSEEHLMKIIGKHSRCIVLYSYIDTMSNIYAILDAPDGSGVGEISIHYEKVDMPIVEINSHREMILQAIRSIEEIDVMPNFERSDSYNIAVPAVNIDDALLNKIFLKKADYMRLFAVNEIKTTNPKMELRYLRASNNTLTPPQSLAFARSIVGSMASTTIENVNTYFTPNEEQSARGGKPLVTSNSMILRFYCYPGLIKVLVENSPSIHETRMAMHWLRAIFIDSHVQVGPSPPPAQGPAAQPQAPAQGPQQKLRKRRPQEGGMNLLLDNLKSIDPEFKEHHYSRICQSGNQPVGVRNEHFKQLLRRPDGLIKESSSYEMRGNYYFCPRYWCWLSGHAVDSKTGKCDKGEKPSQLYTTNQVVTISTSAIKKNLCLPCCAGKKDNAKYMSDCQKKTQKEYQEKTFGIKVPSVMLTPSAFDTTIKKDSITLENYAYGHVNETILTVLRPDIDADENNSYSSVHMNKGIVVYEGVGHGSVPLTASLARLLPEKIRDEFNHYYSESALFTAAVRKYIDPVKFLSIENGNVMRAFAPRRPIYPTPELNAEFKTWLEGHDNYKKTFAISDTYDISIEKNLHMYELSRHLSVMHAYERFLRYVAADTIEKTPDFFYDIMRFFDVTLVVFEIVHVLIETTTRTGHKIHEHVQQTPRMLCPSLRKGWYDFDNIEKVGVIVCNYDKTQSPDQTYTSYIPIIEIIGKEKQTAPPSHKQTPCDPPPMSRRTVLHPLSEDLRKIMQNCGVAAPSEANDYQRIQMAVNHSRAVFPDNPIHTAVLGSDLSIVGLINRELTAYFPIEPPASASVFGHLYADEIVNHFLYYDDIVDAEIVTDADYAAKMAPIIEAKEVGVFEDLNIIPAIPVVSNNDILNKMALEEEATAAKWRDLQIRFGRWMIRKDKSVMRELLADFKKHLDAAKDESEPVKQQRLSDFKKLLYSAPRDSPVLRLWESENAGPMKNQIARYLLEKSPLLVSKETLKKRFYQFADIARLNPDSGMKEKSKRLLQEEKQLLDILIDTMPKGGIVTLKAWVNQLNYQSRFPFTSIEVFPLKRHREHMFSQQAYMAGNADFIFNTDRGIAPRIIFENRGVPEQMPGLVYKSMLEIPSPDSNSPTAAPQQEAAPAPSPPSEPEAPPAQDPYGEPIRMINEEGQEVAVACEHRPYAIGNYLMLWEDNSCYSTSAIHLLYMIPEYVNRICAYTGTNELTRELKRLFTGYNYQAPPLAVKDICRTQNPAGVTTGDPSEVMHKYVDQVDIDFDNLIKIVDGPSPDAFVMEYAFVDATSKTITVPNYYKKIGGILYKKKQPAHYIALMSNPEGVTWYILDDLARTIKESGNYEFIMRDAISNHFEPRIYLYKRNPSEEAALTGGAAAAHEHLPSKWRENSVTFNQYYITKAKINDIYTSVAKQLGVPKVPDLLGALDAVGGKDELERLRHFCRLLNIAAFVIHERKIKTAAATAPRGSPADLRSSRTYIPATCDRPLIIVFMDREGKLSPVVHDEYGFLYKKHHEANPKWLKLLY